jgi:hypothetical protein
MRQLMRQMNLSQALRVWTGPRPDNQALIGPCTVDCERAWPERKLKGRAA